MGKIVKILWVLFMLMLLAFSVTIFISDVYISWCMFSVVAVVWWVAIIVTVIHLIVNKKSK